MVTTFTTRELCRDELVSKFVTNASWQNVYGYFPAASELVGKTPVLLVLSDGTLQRFANLETNPVSYQFLLINFVLADSDSDSWTPALASDNLDDLDRAIRQLIRDNAGSLTTATNLRFADGFSQRRDMNVGGKPYMTETYTVIADLARGAI